MNSRKCNNEKTKQCSGGDEYKEGSIVAFADTIVEPDTMMILSFFVVVLVRVIKRSNKVYLPTQLSH